MAGFYFPKRDDLRRFDPDERKEVEDAVDRLKNTCLPHQWMSDLSSIKFYSDPNMNTDNGVMGYMHYFYPNEVLIAEFLVDQLMSSDRNGIPNNESAISIVIHELTHARQRRWLGGVAYPFLNIKGIDLLTVEKWAVENQEFAERYLMKEYKKMRRELG